MVLSPADVVKEYLTNIYLTLMTRGIKGTYLYICDDALREYFEQYVVLKLLILNLVASAL